MLPVYPPTARMAANDSTYSHMIKSSKNSALFVLSLGEGFHFFIWMRWRSALYNSISKIWLLLWRDICLLHLQESKKGNWRLAETENEYVVFCSSKYSLKDTRVDFCLICEPIFEDYLLRCCPIFVWPIFASMIVHQTHYWQCQKKLSSIVTVSHKDQIPEERSSCIGFVRHQYLTTFCHRPWWFDYILSRTMSPWAFVVWHLEKIGG